MNATILPGDCLDVMRTYPDNHFDAIVTDPPYGLGFMGKAWDALPPGREWAEECLRVLKPGGHILAFGGTRTWHRLAVAIEDAGFEIRDSIAWLYGSGFPKSMNVAKAIASGGGRPEDIRRMQMGEDYTPSGRGRVNYDHGGGSAMNGVAGPAVLTEEAQRWEGWGTALKPAFEPIVLARKPLTGTVAANVLAHGTGALNIDASRVGTSETLARAVSGGGAFRFDGFSTLEELQAAAAVGGLTPTGRNAQATLARFQKFQEAERTEPPGRFPANVILDPSQAATLDQQSGYQKDGIAVQRNRAGQKPNSVYGTYGTTTDDQGFGGGGGASRFFYCAKAPKSERPVVDGVAHETVKPLALMRYLVKLVTPPGGTILDPFAGSGTTLEAAILEGFNAVGIERETRYLPLIQARINRATPEPEGLF